MKHPVKEAVDWLHLERRSCHKSSCEKHRCPVREVTLGCLGWPAEFPRGKGRHPHQAGADLRYRPF